MDIPTASAIQGWALAHTYQELPEEFYAAAAPTPVKAPQLELLNPALAQALGLDVAGPEAGLSELFAGNALPEGSLPIAMAYAGHQFGHFTMLGDGRAILLGEQQAPDGKSYDIQLKGAGITPFSRRGDGRATYAAMLREYLISEAMHHLGIPTSRSLAVARTGEQVYRDPIQDGAVLTRVSSSHLRVGTFEYARRFLPADAQKALLAYAIKRHYPELLGTSQPALELLKAVMARQAKLIAQWMGVGFIHGVMNTDNIGIAAETFDYGPCAFMNAYYPGTVFSSIDTTGRYAYGNQPQMGHWGLAVFASALLPLIHEDQDEAVKLAQATVNQFPELYEAQWKQAMASKLGLDVAGAEEEALIKDLLRWMQQNEADYTNTFRYLTDGSGPGAARCEQDAFREWESRWKSRIEQQAGGMAKARETMARNNPAYIPRNHLVEDALKEAAAGDKSRFEALLSVLSDPYTLQPGQESYQLPPDGGDFGFKTYCGT